MLIKPLRDKYLLGKCKARLHKKSIVVTLFLLNPSLEKEKKTHQFHKVRKLFS